MSISRDMASFNFGYVYSKILKYVKTYLFTRKKFIAENFLLVRPFPLEKAAIKRVLFYFPDETYMHFGDHLFFEPLCRLIRDNGIELTVCPAPSMEFYFKHHGYDTRLQDISNYDVIITKLEFIDENIQLGRNILIIDTAYASIDKPLIEDMLQKLQAYLKLPKAVDPKPLYFDLKNGDLSKFGLSRDKKYIIFNNYIYSGDFRVSRSKFLKLERFIRRFKQTHPEYEIIHLGSLKDKKKDKKEYSFVDHDLRGQTTIGDLFFLCQQDNMIYYIGFDGFLMHLFFMKNKKAYVMSRGRWSSRARFFLENYIDPPYTPSVPVADIKEYIR